MFIIDFNLLHSANTLDPRLISISQEYWLKMVVICQHFTVLHLINLKYLYKYLLSRKCFQASLIQFLYTVMDYTYIHYYSNILIGKNIIFYLFTNLGFVRFLIDQI